MEKGKGGGLGLVIAGLPAGNFARKRGEKNLNEKLVPRKQQKKKIHGRNTAGRAAIRAVLRGGEEKDLINAFKNWGAPRG